MEPNFIEEERYLIAEKKMKYIKGFYVHLAIYVITHCIWMFIVYNFDRFDSFSKYDFFGKGYGVVSSCVLWGVLVLVHWYLVFGKTITFSEKWEERKIKELIENDKNE